MLTKFNSKITCVHVSEHKFTHQDNKTFPYFKCILVDSDGTFFQCSCDEKSYRYLCDSVLDKGFAVLDPNLFSFEIRFFKNDFKIKLTFNK